MYATVLDEHLDIETSKELFDDAIFEIDHEKHKPNQVAKLLFQKINELYKTNVIWRSIDHIKRRSKIIYRNMWRL
jgi:putative membrane protein